MILVYFIYSLYLGAPRAIASNALALAIQGLSWGCDRGLHRERWAAHLFLAGGFAVLFGAALGDGTLEGSGLGHMPLLSLGAGFLLGTRAAIGWALVAALGIGIQAYIHVNVTLVRDYPFTRENVIAMRLFGVVVAAMFGHLSRRTSATRLSKQRRQMKEIQEATRRAEAANAVRSNFLAQVSHELRTPMNGILGMTQFLQLRPSLPARAQEHVETIHRCSSSLLSLFGEILDLSRVESEDWEIQSQPVDLVAVIREVAELFSAQANTGDRSLRVLNLVEDCWVWSDPVRLSQVLSNLVGNAVKFCETGRIEIELVVGKARGPAETPERWVEILVRDEGVGMTRSQSLKVFSEFAQGQTSKPELAAQGTGLGLVISREIVEKMGGRLELESTPGQGSTFSVALPLRACAGSERPSPRPRTDPQALHLSAGSGQALDLHVLVVDDLAINRRVAALALTRLGCRVQEACDGLEAVALAQDTVYDCIFMDLRMPRMDGFEATQKILDESLRNRNTPVVALSASAFEEDRKRCFEVGMVEHLAKPFRASDMRRILMTHVVASVERDTLEEGEAHAA